MRSNYRLCFDAPGASSPGAVTKDDDLLSTSIAHHLRNFCFEVDTINFLQTAIGSPRISGAILLSVEPGQLRLLIADARISIVLALQRHVSNERYRRRLRTEAHYRALRPHLSANFRVLMMAPSNWEGYRFSESRKPSLADAYKNEIDRLEMELLAAPENIGLLVLGPTRRQATR